MTSFTVCQYNIGKDSSDYYQLYSYSDPRKGIKSEEDFEEFKKEYEKVQRIATERLLKSPMQVYCLQEVDRLDRHLVVALQKAGYGLIHYPYEKDKYIDSVIAFDSRVFKLIRNASLLLKINNIFQKDVAIAVLLNIQTKRKVVVASLHVPGFSFMKKKLSNEDLGDGRIYCEKVLELFEKEGKGADIVVGADMNANPEKKQVDFFKMFRKRNFKLLRTKKPTNVNPKDSQFQQREIDFIFYRPRQPTLIKKVKSLVKGDSFLGSILPKRVLEFDPKSNMSDHLPISAQFFLKKT